MAYYVSVGKFYYGKVTHDYLDALILLDEARHVMPAENWTIVSYKL